MACNFRVSYEETEDNLTDVCELFNADNSDLMMKFVSIVLGIIVFIFIMIYGNPGGGTTKGLVFFVIKYIVIWAVVTILMLIINRTLWRKVIKTTSIGDAELLLANRKKSGKGVKSEIEFCEDHFVSVMEIKRREFPYNQVVRLVETKKAFGMVIKQNGSFFQSTRAMVGFPKESLVDGNLDEFRQYMLKKCQKTKNKIKKL